MSVSVGEGLTVTEKSLSECKEEASPTTKIHNTGDYFFNYNQKRKTHHSDFPSITFKNIYVNITVI